MKSKRFFLLFVSLILAAIIVACGSKQFSDTLAVTLPAISVEITGDVCPSVEVQAGMQVTWTNRDNSDHVVWLEREDENGTLIESGGTDLLQPDDTFSITLTEPTQYTYYCTEDRTVFGTISVLP